MKILISHTNFPSQFRRLIPLWLSDGHDVCFLARNREWHSISYEGLHVLPYQLSRDKDNPYTHPYLRRLESAVLEGQSVFRTALQLKSDGWIPDIIISHVGFGNGLYLKDLFL